MGTKGSHRGLFIYHHIWNQSTDHEWEKVFCPIFFMKSNITRIERPYKGHGWPLTVDSVFEILFEGAVTMNF